MSIKTQIKVMVYMLKMYLASEFNLLVQTDRLTDQLHTNTIVDLQNKCQVKVDTILIKCCKAHA